MWKRLKTLLIETLGGYRDAESAISAISDQKEKRRILTQAVKKLFNTVGPEDILQDHAGQWTLAGQPISAGERDRLIAEAERFRESKLWEALVLDLKYLANRAMFTKAQSDDDLTAGKLWAYTINAMETRLKSLAKGSAKLNETVTKK